MLKIKCFLVVIFVLICNFAYSDSIPGYIQLDCSLTNYQNNNLDNNNIYISKINIEYGIFRNLLFSPFLIFEYKTWTLHKDFNHNYPFLKRYTSCIGFNIYNHLYMKLSHSCTHFVLSESMYKKNIISYENSNYPKIHSFIKKMKKNENQFELGFKIIID